MDKEDERKLKELGVEMTKPEKPDASTFDSGGTPHPPPDPPPAPPSPVEGGG